MLRLAKLTDAEYVLGEVAAGLEDYYLGSGEAPGVWSGGLAAQLGLEGVVAPDDLRALIDRVDPASGERMLGPKLPTVRAVDATFSAPKSVSLLWAFAIPEVASVVSLAHVEAVDAALRFVEVHAAVTRRQMGGIRVRAVTSGWAAATFVHRTSREGDPQLHTHALVANVVQRSDGVWVALDATAMYRWAKAAGSVYQEQLRRILSDQLGVDWGPDRNGCREMTGLAETQLRAFSKRTAQIEAHLAATGQDNLSDPRARMAADEAASVATRARKDRTLTPDRLAKRWAAEAETVGLPTGDRLFAAVTARDGRKQIGPGEVSELFGRLVGADTGLCAHDSRFGEAQVVEAVAAWGAGRLSVGDIETLTARFLRSKDVVRLVTGDSSGRAAGQWSTVAHRQMEDRVLEQLAVLGDRQIAALDETAVAAAIAAAGHLGADQVAAVRGLGGPGAALRALISPAGYGKTTTLAAAVAAASGSGRSVLALSTTNQAVDQLRQVGIPASTVARFAIDRVVLEAGSVVIVDEFSQLPTREADLVLAAVAACPGGQVWLVGDPLQAQPVAAGGLAPWLAEQTSQGRVTAVELVVNRRQADPVERQALTAFRAGATDTSRDLRQQAGWEHHHPDRSQALDAMAAAVTADIAVHGPAQVAALAVTHGDCEDLADRIRAELVAGAVIAGPAIRGPGWTVPRDYQAGDRILVHANATLASGHRLTNGTVVTVTHVTDTGVRVRDDNGSAGVLPAGFVTGRGADGRPLVSHAWARTVDGVQGGTWAQVHLLATPAVDRYRGYVGQSRSIAPTHTWNTGPDRPAAGDHGGRIVERYAKPDEEIAAAMARAKPKTFAAGEDPERADRLLRAERAAHRAHLAERPPDVTDQIARADTTVAARQRDVTEAENRLAFWQEREAATAGLRGVTPRRRDLHRDARRHVSFAGPAVDGARDRLETAVSDRNRLAVEDDAGRRFDQDNQWRVERIRQIPHEIDRQWTAAVVEAAKDGHPLAYGGQLLHVARRTLAESRDGQHTGRTVAPGVRADLELLDQAIAQQEQAAKLAARSRQERPAAPEVPLHQRMQQQPEPRAPHIVA